MAILFAASELEAFQLNDTANTTATNTAGEFLSAVARAGADSDLGADLIIPIAGGLTEGWLHFNVWHNDPAGVGTDHFVLFKDTGSGDDGVFRLDPDGNGQDLDINTGTTNWSQLVGNFVPFLGGNQNTTAFDWDYPTHGDNEITTFDIHWIMHDTTGLVEVYVNGVVHGAGFSGDTIRGSNTTVDEIQLSNGTASFTRNAIFSEVIVADEDTRGMRVVTIDPDGAGGTNTAWTGAVTAIDEAAGSVATIDTDSITSDTTGQIEQFTGSAMPTSDYEVLAFVVGFRGGDDAAGVQQVRASVRTGAADFNGATQAMGATLDGFFEVWELNPNTVAAWTPAEIDAIEFGVESIT